MTAVSAKGTIEELPYGVQNDLVYHDYGTGVDLSKGSSLSLKKVDLGLDSAETAVIVAYKMKDQTATKVCDYVPGQKVVYAADKGGVYQLLAVVSNGDIIDLTPDAKIVSVSGTGNNKGFIPLN